MSYRLIATDMDGTLLDDEKKVSDRTLRAIESAKNKGILFSICTGRSITGIKKYIELLKPTGPVICNNGAFINSPDGNNVLYKKLMETKDARSVYELGCELDTTLIIWCGDKFYTNVLNERSYGYEKYSSLKPVLLTDFEELVSRGITKILFSDDPTRINDIAEIVKNRRNSMVNSSGKTVNHWLENTTICQSLPFFLEFFNSAVSKGKAIKFISEYCGIETNEIVAFGDGMNDMPLIEKAGYGVAMGNAFEEVKGIADYVTASNNEDGVALVLERLMAEDI